MSNYDILKKIEEECSGVNNETNNGNTNNIPNNNSNSPFYGQMTNPTNYQGGTLYYPLSNEKEVKTRRTRNILIISAVALIGIIAILITLLFVSSKEKEKEVSRTIMIYMIGSNLETKVSGATGDLESIDYQTMDSENINVVLIAGGTESWNNDYIDAEETSIYELTSTGYQKVKSQELQNMGDPSALTNFLNYVYENYKTDEYDLIFWNHGLGLGGSEQDSLTNDELSLNEIESALEASAFGLDNKLELVIFRTCLNGSLEMAVTLQDYADYLVASEETTFVTTYTSVFDFINDIETSDSAYDVGMKYIGAYQQHVKDYTAFLGRYGMSLEDVFASFYVTYSLVDLSKIDDLVDSINKFFSDVDVTSSYATIARAKSNLYAYAGTDSDYYDMIDLYNFVNELRELSPEKADKVLNNIETAVLYNWATNDSSRGISIYFPYSTKTYTTGFYLGIYSLIDELGDYYAFMSEFNKIQSSGGTNYSFASNAVSVTGDLTNADFTLELTDEQLEGYAKAEYLVMIDKGDGYYWTFYKGNEVTLDGNTLSANINGNHVKVLATEEDEEDLTFPLIETYYDDDYIQYVTYGVLEYLPDNISDWKMDSAEITFQLNRKTKEVSIVSVILQEDGDLPNTIAVNLADYTHLVIGMSSYNIYDEEGNYDPTNMFNRSNGIYEGVEIKIDELENIQVASFDDENDYYCIFRIYDIYNNVYYSDLVKMN